MKFKEWLLGEGGFVGRGLNGVVFAGGEGKVEKFTTNEDEAKLAKWLMDHPHPNVARVYSIDKTKNGWKVVVEKVNTDFDAKRLESLRKKAQAKGHNTPTSIAAYLDSHHADEPHVSGVVAALRHVAKSGKLTDFFNPNNMGLKGGVIKLFDFQ